MTNAMHGCSYVSSYCLKITDFCNKPVQATKETASGSLRKNWCGYKHNRPVVAYRPDQRLTAAAEECNCYVFKYYIGTFNPIGPLMVCVIDRLPDLEEDKLL